MTTTEQNFEQGAEVVLEGRSLNHEGLQAAVDYRGDVKLRLKDKNELEGYLYNFDGRLFSLFPVNSPQAQEVNVDEVHSIVFSGKDAAKGKSWEDWIAKKDSERKAIASAPVVEG